MKNTCQKGNVVEAKVLSRFVEKGYLVFIPFGEGHKCDLVFTDEYNNLKRIQVKACRLTSSNSLIMNLYSNGGGYNKIRYTKDTIDFFATEFEGIIYLIPIELIKNKTTLSMQKLNDFIF